MQLAFKFLPTRESFLSNLEVSPEEDVKVELQAFVSAFSPILAEIHTFLEENKLDDPAKV
jgi:Ca2+:H+ antiporter